MKIAVAKDTLAGSQTIHLSNSKRYLSVMSDYGFRTQSYWRGRGMTSDNIFGQGWGKDGYCATCIPCHISFTGRSTKVTVRTRVYASSGSNNTFRWAIIPYDFDWLFQGCGRIENDSICNQGLFTVSGGDVHYQTFTFIVDNLPSGDFYIYWWRNNTKYGNVHVSGNFEVSVYRETDQFSWHDATPYIWNGSQWKRARAYVNKKDAASGTTQWVQSQ